MKHFRLSHLALAMALVESSRDAEEKLETLYNRGLKHQKVGELDDAVACFKEVLSSRSARNFQVDTANPKGDRTRHITYLSLKNLGAALQAANDLEGSLSYSLEVLGLHTRHLQWMTQTYCFATKQALLRWSWNISRWLVAYLNGDSRRNPITGSAFTN